MRRVTDFTKYSDDELRKLVIENAKPACGGMARVVRELEKKYKACDRAMLLWFINHTYNGELYEADTMQTADAKALKLEMKRKEIELERARHIPRVVRRARTITQPVPTRKYKVPKKKTIQAAFKALGIKATLIDAMVVGIKRIGSYAAIQKVIDDYPEWQVVLL